MESITRHLTKQTKSFCPFQSFHYAKRNTSQFLYSQYKFCFHGNYAEAQIHPIFTIRLHFTQKVVDELPFLLHQNCLHIKEHF